LAFVKSLELSTNRRNQQHKTQPRYTTM